MLPMSVNITILPSDARTDYARHCLASYGAKFLDSWGNFPEEGVVLTGIPFTKNGKSLFKHFFLFLPLTLLLKNSLRITL